MRRRVQIPTPGSYHRLEIVQDEVPVPGSGQVLVTTEAIGVNYADCIVRMGLYSSAKKYVGWPITPGFEFAGKVTQVGDSVSGVKAGDAVMGVTRFGGYASHVVVPEHQIFGLPEGWSMARGAAFSTVHLTAWYALCEIARPRAGYRVLVHNAAGGVGTAALGICRHLRLQATGVVGSPTKIDVARAAGAHYVIDRSTQDLWAEVRRQAPEGYHIILESSGAATLKGSYRALRPMGRLVLFGLATMLPRGGKRVNWFKLAYHYVKIPRLHPFHMLDKNKTVAAFNLSYLFDEHDLLAEAMTELLGWAKEGSLTEPPIATYALEEVRRAHADLESGNTVGKLVLIP